MWGGGYRTEQKTMLGLSASVLAGGTDEFPHLPPGPGQPHTLYIIEYILNTALPFAGWRASPALGAMQEPIPDL